MKMEELIGRLDGSEDPERRALSRTMKRKYLELKREEDITLRNIKFEFLSGCINTMLALGEITDAEEDKLWHELFASLQREEKT